MTTATSGDGGVRDLPEALNTAQKAIELPEVQDMLQRLSSYNLGIFMPHKHSETTGDFEMLPEKVVQVEAGLEVSFRATEEITDQAARFLPVGWYWRAGAATTVAACVMVFEEGVAGAPGNVKHKMPDGN